MFASVSERKRVVLTLESWDTSSLYTYLLKLQNNPGFFTDRIEIISQILSKRRENECTS